MLASTSTPHLPEGALRLRILMTVHGCKPGAVAANADVAPETLSRVLSGRQRAAPETLQRIEHAILREATARVEAERKAQGLPPHIEDSAALRNVAGLVGSQ